MTGPGHNSGADEAASEQLSSFIERIEKLNEEKANLQADIREIFSEAKAFGFEPKVMRKLIQFRKMDKHDLAEQTELVRTYARALGMDDDILG
jgi:uncharacterized protein (UPF0335 family)